MRGDRFHSFQVGVGLPIFSGAQRAKIKSAKSQEMISRNETQIIQLELQTAWQSARLQFERDREIVNSFEQVALKNARAITHALDLRLKNGEINFLEWTVLQQQALQTRMSYLDAVKNLNQSIIQLNYLLSE